MMRKVLVNAYAVSPDKGSEPGMGWNWCVHLAEYCELFIITEGEFREEIEKALPALPQAKHMHFYYLPVSERVREICWNQGDWRFYLHYRKWQKRALAKAREICRETPIDVIHQLNMIGFREPGFLWKIQGPRYIWGPTNCKFEYPMAYWKGASFRNRLAIRLKDFLSRMQLKYSYRVRKAVQRTQVLITASGDAQRLFKKYTGADSIVINETGATAPDPLFDSRPQTGRAPFRMIWVGRLNLYTKMPDLAVRVLAAIPVEDVELHFYGPGDSGSLVALAESLGIGQRCFFHGSVPHDDVLQVMDRMDILLFTSIVEGTPHVVLEALSRRLPVVCFDTCGQGDCVTDKVGIKIPLSTPAQSVKDFAHEVEKLYRDRYRLHQMSQWCPEVCREMSWDSKAKQVWNLYDLF